jgi:hypothetical protein
MPWPLDPRFGCVISQTVPAGPERPTTNRQPFARVKRSPTPMRRGRVQKPCCRHAHTCVDRLERSSGRNASPSGITPSNILSPPGTNLGTRTEVSPGARAQRCRVQHVHGPSESPLGGT